MAASGYSRCGHVRCSRRTHTSGFVFFPITGCTPYNDWTIPDIRTRTPHCPRTHMAGYESVGAESISAPCWIWHTLGTIPAESISAPLPDTKSREGGYEITRGRIRNHARADMESREGGYGITRGRIWNHARADMESAPTIHQKIYYFFI